MELNMTEEELLNKIKAVVVEKLGVKPEDVTTDASVRILWTA